MKCIGSKSASAQQVEKTVNSSVGSRYLAQCIRSLDLLPYWRTYLQIVSQHVTFGGGVFETVSSSHKRNAVGVQMLFYSLPRS